MGEIVRNRTIRPSTRKEDSRYKIDTSKLMPPDTLIVNISHEENEFHVTYKFEGINIYPRKSIHFRVKELKQEIEIFWYNNLTPSK